MKHYRDPGLTVTGVISQRGEPIVRITDGLRVHYEPVSELILNFPAAMARMANRGIVAYGDRAAYIRKQLGDLKYNGEEVIYDACGWNNGVFLDGAKRTFVPEGMSAGYPMFSAPVERYRSSGTIEGWLDSVAGPFAGQLVAEFLFGLMFAGLLVGFTGRTTNPGFGLIGLPEDGKSLLLYIIASVCGPPTSNSSGDGYPLTFSGTSNAIEDEMQNYADMTMIIDEASLFGYGLTPKQRGRLFIDVIMRLSDGREKKRMKALSRNFNFCYINSSNDDWSDIIGPSASPEVLAAITSRLTSIGLKERPFGVLDFLPPEFSEKADFLGGVLAAAERHHGVAMPHLLAQVVEVVAADPEGFKARLLDHIAEFRRMATEGAPRKASRRVLDAFGLVYSASRLARRYGALPESFSPSMSALACYKLHLDSSLPPARPVEIVAALLHDPEVQQLERGQRLDITEEEFQAAKGFKVVSSKKTELIMSPASAERLFDRWKKVYKHDRDVRRIMIREGSRPDTYRRIREAERDRVICFRIMPDWPFLRR